MFIYSLYNKNNKNEIYIGKTSNVTSRLYSHKSSSKYSNRKLYKWIREIGWNSVKCEVLKKCDVTDVNELEVYFIKKYESLGYTLLNEQHTNSYNAQDSFDKLVENKYDIWKIYSTTDISRFEICDMFDISNSMLSKIILENGGSTRKHKLEDYYDTIQHLIMSGVPIREIARRYNVSKNSISNINKGITAYNPKLEYPLNKYVVKDIIKKYQFKSKLKV